MLLYSNYLLYLSFCSCYHHFLSLFPWRFFESDDGSIFSSSLSTDNSFLFLLRREMTGGVVLSPHNVALGIVLRAACLEADSLSAPFRQDLMAFVLNETQVCIDLQMFVPMYSICTHTQSLGGVFVVAFPLIFFELSWQKCERICPTLRILRNRLCDFLKGEHVRECDFVMSKLQEQVRSVCCWYLSRE